MPKTPVNMRLDEALLAAVDAYAAERLSSRTAITEAALRSFLDDASRGVPDPPRAAAAERPRVTPSVPGVRSGMPKPVRESFPSGEAWQAAVRQWRLTQDG